MKRSVCVVLKAAVSLALGGASGSILPFVQAKLAEMSTGKPVSVDGHVVAMLALYGALAAVLGHLAPSPLSSTSCPTCKTSDKTL